MKGIVFTEFLELVEDKFGLETVDEIIEKSDLKTNGVYTSIGTYEFSEMLQLLNNLSVKTKISVDDLLLVYGEHLFGVLRSSYPGLIESYKDPIQMLSSIENHIHVEVRKIYPDAELPSFEVIEKTSKTLTMIYRSSRAMHHFGLGLMNKTFEYFNSNAT
ncbi:MAG: heme NO-binding domain-containing protein, partial [Flavobacteriaceae bacterium]|nr:heme NO-binding domain-containing protein [Flavobacteriaceae bacterium]